MSDDSEAWKGEDQPDNPLRRKGIFFDFDWFGESLTQEEKDAQRVRGELAYLHMPKLGHAEQCPKCGGGKVKLLWANIEADCPSDAVHVGHLHVTCKRCKFTWCRKAKDA